MDHDFITRNNIIKKQSAHRTRSAWSCAAIYTCRTLALAFAEQTNSICIELYNYESHFNYHHLMYDSFNYGLRNSFYMYVCVCSRSSKHSECLLSAYCGFYCCFIPPAMLFATRNSALVSCACAYTSSVCGNAQTQTYK